MSLPITTLASIKRELEAGWKLFDEVYGTFASRDWARKLSKTWTFAWQPYHLACYDDTLARYLEYGLHVPENDKLHLRTLGEIDEWNRREFAKRPPDFTFEDALERMYLSRDRVRLAMADMTESDLVRPTWMPLMFGMVTAGDVLRSIIVHNVAEYWKIWIRTGKKAAAPSPSAVHMRLNFMMNFMPATLNRELAGQKPFTVMWEFAGPGGGAWTLKVSDGACKVSQDVASDPDLTIRMRPETFQKLSAKMAPPPLLMLTGEMKVKGLFAMGRFTKLFPEPGPDQVMQLDASSITRG